MDEDQKFPIFYRGANSHLDFTQTQTFLIFIPTAWPAFLRVVRVKYNVERYVGREARRTNTTFLGPLDWTFIRKAVNHIQNDPVSQNAVSTKSNQILLFGHAFSLNDCFILVKI